MIQCKMMHVCICPCKWINPDSHCILMNTFLPHLADESFSRSLHYRKKYISSHRRQQRLLLFRRTLPRKRRSKASGRKLASKLQKLPPREGQEGPSAEHFSYQMESITKWDLRSLQTYHSVEPCDNFQDEDYLDVSLAPRLQAELWKAQSRIEVLEAEKSRSYQRKHCEENSDLLVDYLKEKLKKERKERKLAKAENSKLKKKIFVMESSEKQLRRERDMMEKVCEELVMRIDELKAETRKIWDTVEEEKQMLHMADMWREERVRVKLMDSKLALEEKYEEMNWFVDELEKSLEMAREVGGIEEVSLIRGKGLIKTARSIEVVDDKMSFERFKFESDEDMI